MNVRLSRDQVNWTLGSRKGEVVPQDSGLSKQVGDKVIHLGRTSGRGTSMEKAWSPDVSIK